MTALKSYDFCILHYMHDTVTRESINVGVVLYSQSGRVIRSQFRNTYARLSAVFPDLNPKHFKKMMRFLQDALEARAHEWENNLDLAGSESLEQVLRSTLPKDDSSLQWSPIASGMTKDLEGEIDQLFSRYVSRYDSQNTRERRTENEMWRDFKKDLEKFNISDRLTPKKITVKDDEMEFKHSWKNGKWHCIEPISFDLSSGDYFREKAHRWLGQLSSVQDAADAFKVYLLVSRPQDPSLSKAFEKALSILHKSPVEMEIYLEDESEKLAQIFSDRIREEDSHLIG